MATRIDLVTRSGTRNAALEQSLDRAVAESIPLVALALAGLYAALVPTHLLLLRYPDRIALAAICGLAAVLFLGVRGILAYRAIPEGWGHPVGALLCGFLITVAYLHLSLSGAPRETSSMILIVIAVGLFFLDLGWFSAVVALALAVWVVAAGDRIGDADWTYFGVSLVLATVLAGTVLVVRRRNFLRVERLRSQERVRQIELESALDQTERSRLEGDSARHSAETAIVQVKESEERFRRLAEATFEGVVFYREERILDANPRAAQIFRVSVSQMVGDPILNLVDPEQRQPAEDFLLGRHLGVETGASDTLEVAGRRYDGTFFPAELAVVDSLHRGEEARVVVVRDVTNQKRAEQMLRRALEEAEANSRAKSSFLANMSHELRTPLNSVIGFANILIKKQGGALPVRESDYLRRIQANGEHLLALIEDILDISKIDAQRMEVVREPVDLEEMAAEVTEMLELQARKRGLEILRDVPPDLRPAIADQRRLKQVVLNLAGNAVKFTQEGTVTLRVEADRVTGRPVRLLVEDTGIGIPGEELEEVFAPFHQIDGSQARSFGGTGLGLAISRSLCELMGFELWARSEVGVGSVFSIEFEPGRKIQQSTAPGNGRVMPGVETGE
ncbi:MAG: PAS domain S-box protein [Gemmatimonadales bacterium]|nr:MAG: PAS domain S-box protein [Gemmatimonadales bacterium]